MLARAATRPRLAQINATVARGGASNRPRDDSSSHCHVAPCLRIGSRAFKSDLVQVYKQEKATDQQQRNDVCTLPASRAAGIAPRAGCHRVAHVHAPTSQSTSARRHRGVACLWCAGLPTPHPHPTPRSAVHVCCTSGARGHPQSAALTLQNRRPPPILGRSGAGRLRRRGCHLGPAPRPSDRTLAPAQLLESAQSRLARGGPGRGIRGASSCVWRVRHLRWPCSRWCSTHGEPTLVRKFRQRLVSPRHVAMR